MEYSIMSITTKKIAEICNVSRGTVDRALNNRPGISDVTRERIKTAAEQYNYRPHLIASGLSRGRSMSIGVVLFDLKNQYFSQISNIISIEARHQDYFTYIAVTEKDLDLEIQILNNLASRQVEGIIILPITQGNEFIQKLHSLEIPVVTIVNRLPGIPHVHINDFDASYDSTHYIVQAGYRQICFICTPIRKKGTHGGRLNISSQDLRVKGFKKYMETNPKFKHELLVQKDFCIQAESIVRKSRQKTAFLCSSDMHALELMRYFRKKHIAIPGDAGIMGFDNLDILSYVQPRLTTMSTSIETVGREALRILFDLIKGKTVSDITYIPHAVYPGETI
jgi:DNA-binding LacI/PurR family transcriptional regulator